MLKLRLLLRTARKSGGFTLVELLVVIGIIAILAGVALGPIANGIKKAKQSSAMQGAHALGLAMYSYANDNNQLFPDKSGGTAADVAIALLGGSYVTDPSIFFISGGTATKYTLAATSAATSLVQTNMSWDFGGNGGNGLSSINYQYLPIFWSTVAPAGSGTEPTLGSANGVNTPVTALPGTGNPLGTAGMAVFYINNSSVFVSSTLVGGVATCTIIKSSDNQGGAPSTATVLTGGG